jgi:hypothetical protein
VQGEIYGQSRAYAGGESKNWLSQRILSLVWLRVTNEAANFLKHADWDVSDPLSFEESEKDGVLGAAHTSNCHAQLRTSQVVAFD